ncbi:PTS system mannose-specific IIA component/D-glucosaminate-specific PTS system IIA component [Sporomusaceae bacterium BoRhaA]|uniref:PTS sugar transporter subunit IIA n=1 Tax=Pelorhabdus rhamnosifermentans TaxID=2772457 RepID=UPI001C061A02|nr:PTS sugar transporter subunit IIA [Pelorhabdus rhamnosifermentans]MBU2703786.1 PTS system mannose-specific IIA component/D-glucosaminate-specific PTS system IIA component [Pelorhabdus rhamnosifermentans]
MSKQEGKVPGIIIVTHGDFGREIIKSAEMIIGVQENVRAVSLLPGVDLAEFLQEVKSVLQEMPDNSLLMCDLFGGTPSNVSAALLTEMKVNAVTGLNLSMLIEACTSRGFMQGQELAGAVVSAGKIGCKNISEEMNHVDHRKLKEE